MQKRREFAGFVDPSGSAPQVRVVSLYFIHPKISVSTLVELFTKVSTKSETLFLAWREYIIVLSMEEFFFFSKAR